MRTQGTMCHPCVELATPPVYHSQQEQLSQEKGQRGSNCCSCGELFHRPPNSCVVDDAKMGRNEYLVAEAALLLPVPCGAMHGTRHQTVPRA
mmetsp:Transcript_51071/g.141430  ORF Transcript_51071/g.141430 Transcript_51071/m.141430 type:complete len:92 (-) Transcript_51071:773-1048(-)